MADNHIEVRKALKRIQSGLASFQQTVGDQVAWYEFDEAASTTDETYTEGPVPGIEFANTYGEAQEAESYNAGEITGGNLFKAAVYVPVIWARYMAPWNTQTDDGSYLTSHISLRIASEQMHKLGLGNPLNPDSHMDDRFTYKSKLYQVQSYEPRGWLRGQYIMVDITGTQLKPADLETDPFPFWEGPTTPWNPLEQLNWPKVPSTSLDT